MSAEVLIFGSSGTLGGALMEVLSNRHETAGTTRNGAEITDRVMYFDFSNPEFPFDLSEAIKSASTIVINAAVPGDGLLVGMTAEKIRETISINFLAPTIIIQEYLRKRLAQSLSARVIVVSSIAASTGFTGLSLYGACKSALEALIRSLAREMGAKKCVFLGVAPGFFESKMSGSLPPAILDSITRRTANKKLVHAGEIAQIVAEMSSGKLDSMSGRVLTVDNGSTL